MSKYKLKSLGKGKITKYNYKKPDNKLLETFKNQHTNNLYVAPFECFEFSSLCPVTGQPDWATFYINYIPNKLCVESKSLKLYLMSYRNSGAFMEDITNKILKDLVNLLNPVYIEVYADFNSRGGIFLRPYANYYNQQFNKDEINNILDRYYKNLKNLK